MLIDPLRDLADQAAERGTRIAIETMPFSAIATVPMGAEIVAAADHSAVGLLIDAWHVFRDVVDDLGALDTEKRSSGSNSTMRPRRRADPLRGHRGQPTAVR